MEHLTDFLKSVGEAVAENDASSAREEAMRRRLNGDDVEPSLRRAILANERLRDRALSAEERKAAERAAIIALDRAHTALVRAEIARVEADAARTKALLRRFVDVYANVERKANDEVQIELFRTWVQAVDALGLPAFREMAGE